MPQPRRELDAGELDATLDEEWFEGTCHGTIPFGGDELCGRSFEGRGTAEARRARDRAQKHVDHTRHALEAKHANAS